MELANYKEVMGMPKAAKVERKEAMISEIRSMYDNHVGNLVETTPGLRRWMLVAKAYTQTHEIDYEETFSPVAKIKSIRIMLAIAAFHDYETMEMDVKTAFLNGKLTKDVFMAQPEGFENAKYPKRVCKLQKAIYGLKQASRSWNLCFHEKVTQFGFSRSEDESYWLGKCFAMKDLGDASYILGIKIYRDRSKRLIRLSQDTYLDKILKRFKMENSKKGNLPLHHGIKIRSIMYAMTCTRPDVSFALSMLVEASKEAIWMKNFIGDLGVVPIVQDPIEIFCDNKSAITLTKEPKDHRKSKHIKKIPFCSKQSRRRTHMIQSLAVALDGTLCLVNQDRLRPIIVDDLSKWETVGFSVQVCPTEDAYSSSKADVVTLTKVMPTKMATHNIRMNTICCGIFKSKITEGLM
ncbi:retrotransposon protein, putative, ty1-copia subclass [Tanacetum coccineum]